ncbi:carbohydrate porin [Rubinisphaera italica]|uniref:Carbohydrate-selective porin, OprB family n=1 Tax=Rubinisphaera italica TaxID=2527969 RepID=A0A5C5XG86_9PLAN|nr:carbohydrate porin [Rubinisphaera italica]TWT61679.1 Carbohydrate-selective porin, OprB family [Rubinisphaera italica]
MRLFVPILLCCVVFAPSVAQAQYGVSGDWAGTRDLLAEHGLTIDLSATQFFQGVAGGGRDEKWDYGGKLDYLVGFEGGKAGLNEGFFIDLHAETRFGESINDDDGLLAPANIAMNFPNSSSHVTSITGLKFTQALSESFAISVGKINTLDEYALKYNGGPGLGGFMNTSLVFNPIASRTVPYSAAGVACAFLDEGKPWLTFAVFDPEERATKGLEDLFARGATFVPELILRPEIFGLPGTYVIGGTYSNADYRAIDPSAWLTVPVTGEFPLETGSWSLYTNFFQALWVDSMDESRQWGLFGQFGVSDGNPNPIEYTAICGLGGRSMLGGRPLDRFGVGYFYLRLSEEFKILSRRIRPQQDEHGLEIFYNFAFSPNCWLTVDLQIAQPSTVAFDTAIIPGARLQVLF